MLIVHPSPEPDDESEESVRGRTEPTSRGTSFADPTEWEVVLPSPPAERREAVESDDFRPPSAKRSKNDPQPEPVDSAKEQKLTRRTVISHALNTGITAGVTGPLGWFGATFFELNPTQDSADDLRSVFDDEGPLDVIVIPEHYQTMQGELWVLPEPVAAGEDIPSWFENPEDWKAWRLLHGAMDLTYTMVRLVVENSWSNDVTLTEISADVSREAPLTGTLMWAPPQGGDSLTAMGFDLDEGEPHAREIDWSLFEQIAFPSVVSPEEYLTNRPYLTSEGIVLPSQGMHTLFILAGGVNHCYEFTIRMKGVANQKTFEQTIDNQGEPFKVTAAPVYTESELGREIDRSSYDVVFEYDFISGWTRTQG